MWAIVHLLPRSVICPDTLNSRIIIQRTALLFLLFNVIILLNIWFWCYPVIEWVFIYTWQAFSSYFVAKVCFLTFHLTTSLLKNIYGCIFLNLSNFNSSVLTREDSLMQTIQKGICFIFLFYERNELKVNFCYFIWSSLTAILNLIGRDSLFPVLDAGLASVCQNLGTFVKRNKKTTLRLQNNRASPVSRDPGNAVPGSRLIGLSRLPGQPGSCSLLRAKIKLAPVSSAVHRISHQPG